MLRAALSAVIVGFLLVLLPISFGILLVLAAGFVILLISSQRARTVGRLRMEFAAGVSHELRTPLAVICSAAHNLRSRIVYVEEAVEHYATIIEDEARRLSDMVDQILLYSETQSGRRKYDLAPVEVTGIVDGAIQNLSPILEKDNHELTTRVEPALPPAKADATALTQCVQNLLSNALKYGRHGDAANIEIAARKASNRPEILLIVRDHGPGIGGGDQRYLFEPYYRGRRPNWNVPGNGLGLYLVKRLMQAQGGRVTFDQPPDGGARFTLHIPVLK
jgi:signal transduction histidine kinase